MASRPLDVFPRPASFFDLAFTLVQTAERAFDFGLVLQFAPGQAPSLRQLQLGAAKALAQHPKSQALLQRRCWVLAPHLTPPLSERSCPSSEEAARAVAEQMAVPFDLRTELGLRQLLIHDPGTGTSRLLTQMHHALGDFVSLVAWLHCQLAQEPIAAPVEALALKSHPGGARKSRYAFTRPCDPIRTTLKAKPSAVRGWKSFAFDHVAVKQAVRKHGTFSYNDLLSSVALATLRGWNNSPRIGLWIPINIRTQPFAGFGNGASRIRIYDHATAGQGFVERAIAVRQQVEWSRSQGEWNAPDLTALVRRWPTWLVRLLFRAFANRPGVDYATTTFSHIEKLGPVSDEALLPGVTRLELIGNLYGTHTLAFGALGFAGKTYMSFTWDQALYAPQDVEAFIALFEDYRRKAFAEVL